jgi:hypothetical protein
MTFSAFLINKNLKDPKMAGPMIVFDKDFHDFGKVKEGPMLETIFEFTNKGEDTLHITSVNTSCGCTGAMLDEKKYFLTGEMGKIKVSFNTMGRQGHQEKDIIVATNDPKTPTKTLKIKTDIER